MKYRKIISIIIYILFFLFLWWPVYGLLSYMFLGNPLRTIVAFSSIGVEVVIGFLAILLTIKTREDMSKIKFRILISVIGTLYTLFLMSIIYFYILT